MIDLKKLYREYPDCFGDSAKFKAYLIDLYPYERKAIINVLATMLSEDVLSSAQTKDALDETAFCKRVCDDYGFHLELVRDCFALFSAIFDTPATKSAAKKSSKKLKPQQSASDPDYPTLDNYDRSKFEIVYGVLETYTGDESEVKIPRGVTAIFDYAFNDCAQLTSVTIPDSVTHICDNAFEGCTALKSIVLPDSVQHIGWGAFNWCEALKSIVIPKGVTYINNSVFGGCSALLSIEVAPDNPVYHSVGNCIVKTKEKILVVGCSNSVIPTDGSVTAIGDGAFAWCDHLKRAVIPLGVTEIGRYAFENCDSLERVEIPDGVTTIRDEAFCLCKRLTSVVIPATVKSMGIKVFEGCDGITVFCEAKSPQRYWRDGWNPDDRPVVWGYGRKKPAKRSLGKKGGYPTLANYDKKIFFIEHGVLQGYSGYKAEVQIPDGVTTIGSNAFYGCNTITSVTIPDSVRLIENHAFGDCTALESIVVPRGVQSIENAVFSGCAALSTVVLPVGIKSIGDHAFYGCESLKSITLPDSVRLIEHHAFGGCRLLESFVIPNGVESIENGTFDGCKLLKDVTIPNSVTAIGKLAFNCCSMLERIVIPDSVTMIDENAFNGCKLLEIYCEAQTQPRGWKYNWNGLKRPVVWGYSGQPSARTRPGKGGKKGAYPTLRNYDSSKFVIDGDILTEYTGKQHTVEIPDGVRVINDWAFNECSFIKSIVIPDSVTIIGDWAFNECSSLTSLIIPPGVTTIGNWAFDECRALERVVIPAGVKNMGTCVFDECGKVTVFCEAKSKPWGWNVDWNSGNRPVIWGYKGK